MDGVKTANAGLAGDFEMRECHAILLVGASNSGKTSLINAMINCVFDFEWEDSFRIQLMDEKDDGQMDREEEDGKFALKFATNM